jgi:phosphoenolpyruvate synthase/pyruvate phosphate dikinase
MNPIRERLYKYACDVVDSWSFDTMKEYAETEIHKEIETKFLYDPGKMEQEMHDFYEENKPSQNKRFKEITILHDYSVTIEDKIMVPVDANIDDAYIKWGRITLLENQNNDDPALDQAAESEEVGFIESNLNYEMDFKRPDSVLVHDGEKVLVSYGTDAEETEKFWQEMLDNRKKRNEKEPYFGPEDPDVIIEIPSEGNL